MTRRELFVHFDAIRSTLAQQEQRRGKPGFGEWVVATLPAFAARLDEIDAAEDRAYGRVLSAWGDWLEARRLSWRGRQTWEIPSGGPLLFTPPSMSGLMRRAGELLKELNLEDALIRSVRYGVGPTENTRGGRGRKMERGMTVRK